MTRWIPDHVLEKLVRSKTEIMIGDVYEDLPGRPIYTITRLSEDFIGIGIGLALLRDSLKKKKNVVENHNATRRKFLKGAAAAGAFWLVEPSIYALLRGWPRVGTVATERENALSRIIDKAHGISTKTHPEEIDNGFFRDLIMADKMLTVAEEFERRTGRKAKMGFNVEYGHNGIEDFLRVGHDVCRWIIERYPTKVLKFIANINGGNESLWTARLFKLPKDFSVGPETDWSNVEDRKVIDVELQKTLVPRLKTPV